MSRPDVVVHRYIKKFPVLETLQATGQFRTKVLHSVADNVKECLKANKIHAIGPL